MTPDRPTTRARSKTPGNTQRIQDRAKASLSKADRELIEEGEINFAAHFIGSMVSLGVGFGLGHTVQGRWLKRGWVFTASELLGLYIFLSNICLADRAYDCDESTDDSTAVFGLVLFAGARIAGVADATVGPFLHNDRVRLAKERLRAHRRTIAVPYLLPKDTGVVGGFALQF